MAGQAFAQLRKNMAITQRPVGALYLTTTTSALCSPVDAVYVQRPAPQQRARRSGLDDSRRRSD